jgi:hypothetical protein
MGLIISRDAQNTIIMNDSYAAIAAFRHLDAE